MPTKKGMINMTPKLINCCLCGHTVATNANCCPYCGNREFISDAQRKILRQEYEREVHRTEERQLKEGQDLCSRIRSKIRAKGKLFSGRIVQTTVGRIDSWYSPSKHEYKYFLDGDSHQNFIRKNRLDEEDYKDLPAYIILPYGEHEVSICVSRYGKKYDDEEYRKYVKYTKRFTVSRDDIDFICIDAFVHFESRCGFLSEYCSDSFRKFEVRESKFNFEHNIEIEREKKSYMFFPAGGIEEIYYLAELVGESLPNRSEFRKLFIPQSSERSY